MTTIPLTLSARLAPPIQAVHRFTRYSIAVGSLSVALFFGFKPAAMGAIVLTAVGTPSFDMVDSHLYTAPTSGYFQALFPAHFPRAPHLGPYTSEFSNGLALAGYQEKQVFSVADFTAPTAVHLGFVLVPNAQAPIGSSFDFASGPIIPVAGGLPIAVSGDVFLNGAPFELGAFGFNITSSDGFNGLSHVVADVWENSAFAPPGLASLVGDYEYRLTIRDPSQNGYNVVGSFSVTAVPEPSTALFFLATATLLSFRRQRRECKKGSGAYLVE